MHRLGIVPFSYNIVRLDILVPSNHSHNMLCFPVQSLPPCFWTDCCVIGLQSTGEAAANDATKKAGVTDEAMMDGFVSAPQQALRKTILSVFPPAPKPRGVIAPDFIYPKMDVRRK